MFTISHTSDNLHVKTRAWVQLYLFLQLHTYTTLVQTNKLSGLQNAPTTQSPSNPLATARRGQLLAMLDRGTIKLTKAHNQLQQVRACQAWCSTQVGWNSTCVAVTGPQCPFFVLQQGAAESMLQSHCH